MGSGVMIYIPSFIKIGSGIQMLMGKGGYIDTAQSSHKESKLKILGISGEYTR
jgi:hypothetical protein